MNRMLGFVLAAAVATTGCAGASREVKRRAPRMAAAAFTEPTAPSAATEAAARGPYAGLAAAIAPAELRGQVEGLLARLGAEPSSPDLREELGRLLVDSGHAKAALAPLQDAFYLRPGRMATASMLARAFVESDRGDDALALARRLVEERPEAAERWLFRAEVERRLGRLDAAVKSASRCLLIAPRTHAARAVLGFAYADLGRRAIARDLLLEAVEGESIERHAIEHRLGRLAMDDEDWQAALEHLGRSLQHLPDYAAALNDRGVVYARLGRWGEAKTDFAAAVKLDAGLAEAQLNLANLLVDEGAEPAALAALRSASEAGTDPAAFFVAAGRLYALGVSTATGRSAAVSYLRRARELVAADARAAIDRALAKIDGLPPPAMPKSTVEAVEVPAPQPAPAKAPPTAAPAPAPGRTGIKPGAPVDAFRPSVD